MTVQTSTNVASFNGDAANKVFPIGYKFNSAADLVVVLLDDQAKTTQILTLNSDYTVTGAGDEEGGVVTLAVAPTSVQRLKVTRVVDILQLTDLRNQGKFYAEIHEDVFDLLIMIDQQQQTEIDDANAKSDEAVATANEANAKSDQAVAKADQNLVDMQAQYDAFEQGASLVVIGDYAAGLVVDGYNKVFRKDGEFYRAKAETTLPYPLNGDWAVDAPKFVSVGDAVLREDLSIVSVREYTGAPDGTSSNQVGIEQAVSEALTKGADLYWPAGAYVSDANIPGFHSVRHVGSGVVKRGADTFKIRPGGGQENLLYVSSSGSDSNDGLSAAQPFLTIQAAVNAWAVYARQTSGNWKIKVAAGTYSAGVVIDGIRSPTELVIEGELSGSTKASILDGALAQASGINANSGVRIRTKNLHVRNFTSNGIAAQNGSFLTIDSCDISGCPTFGANASEFSDMNIVGACTITVPAGGRGVRYYRQSTGSICDGTNPVVVQGLGVVADGVQVRDNSYVVCNNGLTVDGFANTGIWIYKHSYLELRNSTISNSATGIKVDALSFLANLTGTITYTGNTKNIAYTGFSFPYGQTKNTVIGSSGASSQVSSGSYDLVITNNGESGIQALTNGGIFNIDVNFLNRLSFASDNSMRYWLNGVDTYRMRTDAYIPVADNTKALGVSSNRWSVLYAGTGTINTSDERSKQKIKPIDAAALRAWSRVEYCQYKFNDAVEAKGDGARWHFGLVAQRVKEAFEAEGLNAFDYGLLCYDEWVETPAVEEQRNDDGAVVVEATPYRPAGNRYGIRYEEALALECAFLRSQLAGVSG